MIKDAAKAQMPATPILVEWNKTTRKKMKL
jgi:hypothetical protein